MKHIFLIFLLAVIVTSCAQTHHMTTVSAPHFTGGGEVEATGSFNTKGAYYSIGYSPVDNFALYFNGMNLGDGKPRNDHGTNQFEAGKAHDLAFGYFDNYKNTYFALFIGGGLGSSSVLDHDNNPDFSDHFAAGMEDYEVNPGNDRYEEIEYRKTFGNIITGLDYTQEHYMSLLFASQLSYMNADVYYEKKAHTDIIWDGTQHLYYLTFAYVFYWGPRALRFYHQGELSLDVKNNDPAIDNMSPFRFVMGISMEFSSLYNWFTQ